MLLAVSASTVRVKFPEASTSVSDPSMIEKDPSEFILAADTT